MTRQKTALVTGGNRGIGLEICRQLAANNIKVILAARDPHKGDKALAKLDNPLVSSIQLDVTNEADLQSLQSKLESRALEVDILVNNAGISQGIRYSILNEPKELTQQTMDINFWGALRLSQIVVPFMQKNGFGRVVNVSSGHGSFGKMDKQNPGYRFSKVTMNAMTVMLADEVKDDNILVNAMTPGWVRTRLGGLNAQRGVEEGAETAVWLCLLDDDGPNGEFFKDKATFAW
jgi:NAD(P)-dependent dehydrogenase (short-subunit alcohol dehydrogenase family)